MTAVDLGTFLLARLDEDEQAAHRAFGDDLGSAWRHTAYGTVLDADGAPVLLRHDGAPTDGEAEHIARHDPARVLTEVEAKRAIIVEHHQESPYCAVCADPPSYEAAWRQFPCTTLRLLALPYADHPDYQQEWKP